MKSAQNEGPLSFWRTVRLLLGVARKRTKGRRTRQQELLNRRSASATDWGVLSVLFAFLFMGFLNGAAAFVVKLAVETCQRVQVEQSGKIVVSPRFLSSLSRRADDSDYDRQARHIVEEEGGDRQAIEQRLRDDEQNYSDSHLISSDDASPGMKSLGDSGRVAAMTGSLVLLVWGMMLVFQGEGLELDVQRRRHPIWEWIFTHPVQPGAVFLAEMLSPIAANSVFWTGPLFAGILYGFIYGGEIGIVAALVIGVPVTVSAACLGKALEIAVMLRFAPRTRGAIIGLMNWLGYASLMLFFIGLFIVPRFITFTWKILSLLAVLPWPWLGWFVGERPNGSFSFAAGALACLAGSMAITAFSVWFSVWGAQRGLAGNFAAMVVRPRILKEGRRRFGKDPLYRKEFLWFIRDRSAIVQTILIPLTVASVQIFNLRRVLVHAQGAWNYLCGAAILFGTYFLWILGPKSLTSEGSALWIALTWPRGLESLLKAKAWLWTLISTGIVALVMGYACFVFPHEIWKIALVGVGWYFFGRSMAEKSVTLVTITSESGEVQKVKSGQRWAAQLGMLTFSIGILTQQWHIAFIGIVYSYLTAAAMWQNFRARLPFLYDPWSEELPPPPTLMHAMVSISVLVEGGAVVSGLALVGLGRENIAVARAIGYAICAVVVSFCVSNFLENRGVSLRDVWMWPAPEQEDEEPEKVWRRVLERARVSAPALLAGIGGGLLLGMFGRGYQLALEHLPLTAQMMRDAHKQMESIPNLHVSYFIMAVFFAPLAEEYLFRGLLYRALDREWGGWRAVVGSAAFFAIYHPPLAWIPVAMVGAANAVLFKKTGRLWSAVALHLVYNAVVLS
jgi:membrane protease YdiL (CAAX protease family)